MKIDMDHRQRSHIANLLRKEAERCRSNADDALQNVRVRKEWLDEARFSDTLAILIDDGEEPVERYQLNRDLASTERPLARPLRETPTTDNVL